MDTAESRMRMLQSSGQTKNEKTGGGKIRFLLALILFLLFFTLEQKEFTVWGLSGEKIYETVCENAKGFDFVLDFPYTLDD